MEKDIHIDTEATLCLNLCPTSYLNKEQKSLLYNYILHTLLIILGQSVMPGTFPTGSFMHPAPSCKDIPSSSPSGHYWIQSTSTGYATLEALCPDLTSLVPRPHPQIEKGSDDD